MQSYDMIVLIAERVRNHPRSSWDLNQDDLDFLFCGFVSHSLGKKILKLLVYYVGLTPPQPKITDFLKDIQEVPSFYLQCVYFSISVVMAV